MRCCDLTLPTPGENLACDEALLEECEASGTEILRFWEAPSHFVVVGYANHVRREVDVAFCERAAIPILRRTTGGGTVLQGPGCLNYSLILRVPVSGPLRTISGTNTLILSRHCEALAPLLPSPATREGQTDLAVGGLKFSGNAQRRRREVLLFHGTFLLEFDLGLISKALPFPSRQPEYRRNRSHAEFLTNLRLPTEQIKRTLAQAWQANAPAVGVPADRIGRLVREKYSRKDWNLKF